jgi:hydrogenase maturation factor
LIAVHPDQVDRLIESLNENAAICAQVVGRIEQRTGSEWLIVSGAENSI